MCVHSSEMEKRAADAERASIKYKQVEFMTDKLGKEFDAVITGVADFGIFAEIIDSKCRRAHQHARTRRRLLLRRSTALIGKIAR